MVCLYGNKLISLPHCKISQMNKRKLKIAFLDMEREFLSSLPEKAQRKITYNLLKVEGGEIDKELFKKLEN